MSGVNKMKKGDGRGYYHYPVYDTHWGKIFLEVSLYFYLQVVFFNFNEKPFENSIENKNICDLMKDSTLVCDTLH